MDILFLVNLLGQFVEVCKHFKVRFNDNYVSAMCEDGTWKDFIDDIADIIELDYGGNK